MSEIEFTKKLITIVSPCFNESEVIELFYEKLKFQLALIEIFSFEIIFVDDGSSDDTLIKLNHLAKKDSRIKIYSLSRNFGHQVALTAGIDFAKGEAVILMDSDLQHPPDLISCMISKWQEGFDIVSAVRKDTKGVSLFKKFTSKTFYFLLNKLSNTYLPEGAADFCLLSHNVYQELRNMRERHRFLRGIISWMGYNRTYLDYEAPKRAAGQSKYTFFRMLSLAIEATLSFSSAPLKFATRLGFIITISGFVYLIWILIRFFVLRDLVQGWASLICAVLILGGCQLTFIGLVGQYLARVFEEVKERPIYLLKQKPDNPYDTATKNRTI
jgi:dolichol-phosphate mannosyltransferase